MKHKQVAQLWLATHGGPKRLADDLACLLHRTFQLGVGYRFTRHEQENNKCLRCDSTHELVFCVLDAFDSEGTFCEPCRDLNWKILRENNER